MVIPENILIGPPESKGLIENTIDVHMHVFMIKKLTELKKLLKETECLPLCTMQMEQLSQYFTDSTRMSRMQKNFENPEKLTRKREL